jgi:hypothetical protein
MFPQFGEFKFTSWTECGYVFGFDRRAVATHLCPVCPRREGRFEVIGEHERPGDGCCYDASERRDGYGVSALGGGSRGHGWTPVPALEVGAHCDDLHDLAPVRLPEDLDGAQQTFVVARFP